MNAETSTDLLRWILIAPLVGASINGLFNRSKNATLAGVIGTLGAAIAFLISVTALSKYGASNVTDAWFQWFEAGRIKVPFTLELTPITAVMLMVVTGIGSLIHVYAIGYMSHEKTPWRFFAYLNLFLAAMLVLILSSNLVGVFLGWEGVGLCSYLLIGYWYEKNENTAAGMKAFLTNRIGDLGFLIAIFAVFGFAGTGQISELVKMSATENPQVPALLWLLLTSGLFWASTGKSAQLPLYVWLPDAMAGPTPVSALIHAATMVTSGVFVTTRLWPIFSHQHDVLQVMLVVGLATAWIAALTALTQRDIKKVLAYSTVSQLGFMFAALGAGAPIAALFHVVTHACFKALLFLGAGSVIHGMHEKQDLFEMGGLRKHMGQTHATFLIGTLAIIGFPLTSGFFSKDMILSKGYEHNPVAYVLLLGAAVLTAFYMLRAYTLAFWGEARSKEASHAHESPLVMTIPLIVLAALSLFVGWLETPAILGGIHTFGRWVESSWYGVSPAVHEGAELSHGAEWLLVLLTSAASLSIAWFSYKNYDGKGAVKAFITLPESLVKLSENKFYVDEIYESVFLKPLAWVARGISDFLDSKIINGTLHGMRDVVRVSGQALSLFHTGNVQTYAWYLAFGSGLALLISWMVHK